MNKDQQIIFAIYKDDILLGYRADTFGTLSMKYPKIYGYSKEQVKIVTDNIRSQCNHSGSELLKAIAGITTIATTVGGDPISLEAVSGSVLKQEEDLRDLGQFEVRVIPFNISRDEWYELGEGEEWKKQQILDNLPDPIEVHKFCIVDDEN